MAIFPLSTQPGASASLPLNLLFLVGYPFGVGSLAGFLASNWAIFSSQDIPGLFAVVHDAHGEDAQVLAGGLCHHQQSSPTAHPSCCLCLQLPVAQGTGDGNDLRHTKLIITLKCCTLTLRESVGKYRASVLWPRWEGDAVESMWT